MLPEPLQSDELASTMPAAVTEAVTGGKQELGELTLEIIPENIVEVCRRLKNEQQFNRLSAVTCVDWYPQKARFEVVYHLHSIPRNRRLRLKCRAESEIDSVTGVWAAADWYEREVFDLFGVIFRNHPNLARILMPEAWQSYPLRKDYPVHGHKYDYQSE